ncbi:histone H3 [Cymbomonas tetramitiformis]|uniref:Histone H3 n=1 Tax=Cymbomonas tetramitiformis TaxID=36881 RepID=A0AAE0C6F4_9CHLO|nr:histone H3 [Cymbomonas tetramitiformis]|eukprot:gene141-234_t
MPRIKQTAPIKTNKTVLHLVSRASQANKNIKGADRNDAEVIQKKRRKKPGTGALLEMRRLQKSDKDVIPKSSFRKLIREVLNDASSASSLRMQGNAVRILREMSAKYLHHIFVLGNALCVKENRLELSLKDFVMATNIVSGDFQKSLDMPDASDRLLRAPLLSMHRLVAPSETKKAPDHVKQEIKPAKVFKKSKNVTTKVKNLDDTASEDSKHFAEE